ncbi:MAG: peptide-methionine (S)-S-oxide reductase MsrA [Janthinobacterium lividum]
MPDDSPSPTTVADRPISVAVLGGGCFWSLEAIYKELNGVVTAYSGYAGGGALPTYTQVCSGRTGHAEVVRVEYDPVTVSYADLLRVFFAIHDPTTLHRQGADVGSQYRSVIFTSRDEERCTAEMVMREVAGAGLWNGPIVTEITDLPTFYPAEAEHIDYFALHAGAGYCRVVIAPKIKAFRKQFADRLRKP